MTSSLFGLGRGPVDCLGFLALGNESSYLSTDSDTSFNVEIRFGYFTVQNFDDMPLAKASCCRDPLDR